jgi:hypothetical protein
MKCLNIYSTDSGGRRPRGCDGQDAGPSDAAVSDPRQSRARRDLVQRRTAHSRHQARPHQNQTVSLLFLWFPFCPECSLFVHHIRIGLKWLARA